VCTGAYVSMQTALAHPNVVGCMGVNLPYFLWPQTQSDSRARHAPLRAYLRSVRSLQKWRRLLTGKSDTLRIVGHVASRIGQHVAVRVAAPLEGIFGLRTAASEVRGLARGLGRKKVETALVYGAMDAGLDDLVLYFGTGGEELKKLARASVTIIDRLDHALFSTAAREAAISHFEHFLRERIQVAMPHRIEAETRRADSMPTGAVNAAQAG
jgi:hypothetical protein